MAVVRERALLARTLLLEIAVQAACDAGALDLGAVDRRREALADQWPEGIDPEQLLDTRSGLAARLERAVAHSEEHRRRAEEMHERASLRARRGEGDARARAVDAGRADAVARRRPRGARAAGAPRRMMQCPAWPSWSPSATARRR